MTNDTPIPEASLLAPKLKSLNGIPLVKALNKDKWSIVTETVSEMYRLLYIPLKKFSPLVFEMFEIDLSAIVEALADAPKKEVDHDKILEYLGVCRRKASQASECYGSKDPLQRDIGKEAAITLQKNLKNALEYIDPINKKYNPSLYTKDTASSGRTNSPANKTH